MMFGLVSAGGFLFLQLASEVTEGDTRGFDEEILLSLRRANDLSVPIGPGWLTHSVDDITSLGGTTVLTLITLVTVFYLLIIRQRRLGIFVLLGVLGGWGISTLLKLGIARPRPEIVPHLVDVHDLSFPSGHAMLSAVTYLTLGALLSRLQLRRSARIYIICIAVLLTLLIGMSRVYLGVHYPTDVLGGWCAGTVWATLCWIVARTLVFGTESREKEELHESR
nr:phosphatase PAP2 family protein [Pararhizobium capsulatum]